MSHVINAMIGTARKRNNVPQANAFCQKPSKIKFLTGHIPIPPNIKAIKPTSRPNAIVPATNKKKALNNTPIT
jgi:hypothetical protein